MSEEFGWSRGSISLAAALGTLVNGATQPFLGRLYDGIGGRRVIIPGLIVIGLATVFLSLAYRVVADFGIRSATARPRASGFRGLSLCYPLNRPSAGFHYFCRAVTLVTGYQGQSGPWKPPVATAEPPRSWSTAF